jgi:hypothetical protein
MEQTQLALKATLSGYIDAATGAERIAKANALATTQMDRLKAASAETGIDFNELATAFKTFLPGALSVGMSLDQATKSATRLTQAAKIQGVEFNALLAGIDGVARGTILANSDFGRFLGGIGLTNEALKEATKTSQTYALIMQKTADIPAVAATGANNYNTALADLNKTIEELRGEMTKPMFEAMIEGMQEFNKFLKDNKELIKSLPSAIGSLTKSVVIFGASLWAINRGVKAFELLKVAFASGAAAIKTARTSMVTLEGAYSAASVRAGVLATAQRALGAAFRATPWGIVIAGLAAITEHFLSAKSAAEELTESWDGTRESLEGYTKAQILSIRAQVEADMRDNTREQASIKRSFWSGRISYEDLSVDDQAKIDTLNQAYAKLQERVKTLDDAYYNLGKTKNAAVEEVALRAFNPDDAARMLRELQEERDKAVLGELDKLERWRVATVDQLVRSVDPNSDQFAQSVVLIGEIYMSEYDKIIAKSADAKQKLLSSISAFAATEIAKVKATFDKYRDEANKTLKGDELAQANKKIDAAEKKEISAINAKAREQEIARLLGLERQRLTTRQLLVDNQALSGAITKDEADQQKKLLAIDYEIMQTEKQIAIAKDKSAAQALQDQIDALNEQKSLMQTAAPENEYIKEINEQFANATKSEVELITARFNEARTQAALLIKNDAAALEDVINKLNEMEGIELKRIGREEAQQIVDEAIRANNALKEISELAIDNAVLRGEITEEEANQKKQILAYETEILNIERQLASLETQADATRIAELTKTYDLLKEQQALVANQPLAKPMLKSLSESFAGAITDGLVKGFEDGKIDVANILADVAKSASGAFSANFSQQLSGGIGTMLSGGGMAGFDPVSMATSLAASYALNHIASVLTAEWKITKQIDYLQEITDNTRRTYETFAIYSQMQQRFNGRVITQVVTPALANAAAPQTGMEIGRRNLAPDDWRNWIFGGARVLGEYYTYLTDLTSNVIGGKAGAAIGEFGYSVFGGHKYKTSGDDGSLGYINISAPDYAQNNIKDAQNLVLDWFDDFWSTTTKFNLKIGEETKKSKGWVGTKKETTEFFKQVTEAEAQMLGWLKQFGTTQYGDELTEEGLKKLGDHLNAIYQIIDTADAYMARLRGENMNEYALKKAEANLYIAQRGMLAYVEAANSLGTNISTDLSRSAEWLTEDIYSQIVGALGAGVEAEEFERIFGSMAQSLLDVESATNAAKEATIAYQKELYAGKQAEAEYIEWMRQSAAELQSALDNANRSLYGVIEGLRSMANEARSLASDTHRGDSAYYQRLYADRLESFNDLFDGGALKGTATEADVKETWNLLSDASKGLTDALPDYEQDIRQAMESSLLSVADLLDLSADILSVRIVGDAVGLASEQTINDLISAINRTNDDLLADVSKPLTWADISSDMGDQALRRLGSISGAATKEELSGTQGLLNTLKIGDNESDRAVWNSLLDRAANGDTDASRQLELARSAIGHLGADGNVTLEQVENERANTAAQKEAQRQARIRQALDYLVHNAEATTRYEMQQQPKVWLYDADWYEGYIAQMGQELIYSLGLDTKDVVELREAFAPYYRDAWEDMWLKQNEAVEKIRRYYEDMGFRGVEIPLPEPISRTPPPIPFAKGGIVQGASMFGFNRQLGVMGERGAEAIIPLPDGRSLPIDMRGGFDDLADRLAAIEEALERLNAIERSALNFAVAADRRDRRHEAIGYPVRDVDDDAKPVEAA